MGRHGGLGQAQFRHQIGHPCLARCQPLDNRQPGWVTQRPEQRRGRSQHCPRTGVSQHRHLPIITRSTDAGKTPLLSGLHLAGIRERSGC